MSIEEQFDFYWKEIFNGLSYNPIEFNTYRFDQSMSLPGKVNKLYDMFKVLAMNNQEVMDYLKEFVETFDEKLYETLEDVLTVWLEDGRLADVVRASINEEVIEARNDYSSLKERLDTENEEVVDARNLYSSLKERLDVESEEKEAHSIYGKRILNISSFPKLNGEMYDRQRIQRLIDESNDYDVLVFPSDVSYELDNQPLRINKPLTLIGYQSEFIVKVKNNIYSLVVENTKDIVVEGFRFNQNLLGRNSLWFENVENISVTNCYFTGYTAEYSYYQTDSALMLYKTKNAFVTNCRFENHGYQYGTATETLNRCITNQGGSVKTIIDTCFFNYVNQAVVHDSGDITVTNCFFERTRDNDLYLLGGNALIDNCYMNDYHDESIVLGNMDNVSISNIVAKNIPNKFIALTNHCKNVYLNNISVHNEELGHGQLFVYRTSTLSIETLTIQNLTFKNESYDFNYPFIEIFNVKKLHINNLDMKVHIQQDQNVIVFNNCEGVIENLGFIQLSGGGNGNINLGTDSNLKIINPFLIGSRINKSSNMSTIGGYLSTSASNAYLSKDSGRSIFYVENIPQPQNESGTRWKEGDIAINVKINPDNATNTNQLAWLFTGKEWRVLFRSTDNRGGTFSPIGKATPFFLGEIFIRTDLEEVYIATGVGNQEKWKRVDV